MARPLETDYLRMSRQDLINKIAAIRAMARDRQMRKRARQWAKVRAAKRRQSRSDRQEGL